MKRLIHYLLIVERNSSGKTISLIDVERNEFFNDAKFDTQVGGKCSEDNTDMHT